MVLEKEKILKELGGIPESVYDELVQEFLVQSREQQELIKKACETESYTDASTVVHSIKGAAGNLRLTEVYDVARSLEDRFVKKAVDGEVQNLLNILNEKLREVENIYTM